jgi:2-keto-4-pentenoate hydratase/2-oxohepta-3-ene-1,7-dioic acid hydratase in catechol pathway
MHLITFEQNNQRCIGVLDKNRNELIDLVAAVPDFPTDMLGLITASESWLEKAGAAVASGKARLPVSGIKILAPIPRPVRNILCVGKNYRDHVTELQSSLPTAGDGAPDLPIIFTKATTSVIGPSDTIPASLDPTDSADYEGELAVVIGKGGRGIPHDQAMEHIFGYTIINDVTSRRMQKGHQQWFLGKSLDGFCPMGPSLVTRNEIPDVTQLQVRTEVNGELRQDGKVVQMIFDIPTLIETLSQTMTLVPGDIIATGTPAGVGMGFNPPRFLKPGDRVVVTIEPIGILENPVG